MKNKGLSLLLLLLTLASCQYFNRPVPDADALLEKELKSINWNQVDEWPSFDNCDSLTDKTQKNQCFLSQLNQLVQEKLNTDTLAILYPEIDTLQLKVTVLPNATFEFNTQTNQANPYNTTTLDSIFKARLVDFPKVHPAIKRGLPVKTQFVLPVILNVAKR
jgi:hypothetical protein